jgi:hypothetical protein
MLKINSLYKDFFKFLDNIQHFPSKWDGYLKLYYSPNKEFLDNYFSYFPFLNFSSLKNRVESIKISDYSLIKNFISLNPPEKIIEDAFIKCKKLAPPPQPPEIYLFFGFFSPDAFVIKFKGRPVICFGLERFKDFKLLKLLFAHEYAHYLININREKISFGEKIKELLISEGIGTYFSFTVFPDYRIYEHFLFTKDLYNWCLKNENYLRNIYCSGKFSFEELIKFYTIGNIDLNLPPRAGKYLGFKAVKNFLEKNKKSIKNLFHNPSLISSIEL